MIVNFIVNLCQFKECILFLHIGSSMLLRYANQNNYFIVYISFFVLVTNAERILLTKTKRLFP